MTSIESITLHSDDPTAAEQFYEDAFGLGDRVRAAAPDGATTGFRGFSVSLIVPSPSNVSSLVDSALAAGATALKPVTKSMWGYGGVVRAPDGSIWKVATSSKKQTGAPARQVDQIVVLLGANDVGASKKFYLDHGLTVGKSFGSYVEFAMPDSPIRLGLYKRPALAKDAGVSPDGSGSHRMVMAWDAGSSTDPDGFTWA